MPEITSVENIRAKLREFDERVDGAIIAAKALTRIKGDAEKVLDDIHDISGKSEESLQKADEIRSKLQELQLEWDTLRQKVEKSETESKESRDLVLSELDSAIQSIGKKVAESEDRLKTANKTSLAEQAELLSRLDGSTRVNAETVANTKRLVLEKSDKLSQLLSTIRDELQIETRAKLLDAEKLLDTQLKATEQQIREKFLSTTQTLTKTAENNERVVRELMGAFKQEMKLNLSEHQQVIDRQLTDFLNKQNALVQNLGQQIDSYNRSSRLQSAELASTNAKIGEVGAALNAHKTTVTNELSALSVCMVELKGLLANVQAGLTSQDQANLALKIALQTTAARLEQTIDKLKQIPLVGSKFK